MTHSNNNNNNNNDDNTNQSSKDDAKKQENIKDNSTSIIQVDDPLPANSNSNNNNNNNNNSNNNNLISKIEKPKNPWKIFTSLNATQRITFLAAFLGWTLDAFDFFILNFTVSYIADEFGLQTSTIAASITVTLMLRPVGALIFGLLADRYGRRYPLMFDIILYSLMELLSGFAPNFTTLMVFRAIFGIAMGGEWGLGSAMAMETLPLETRGMFSGILQQGYAFGYLLASVVYYFVIDSLGWRAMFWIGSFPALLVIIIRFFVPESPVWESQQEKKLSSSNGRGDGAKLWLTDIKLLLKNHWRRFIYTVVLMSCFSFMSHGTQDLYPTFLRVQLGFTSAQITTTLIIANVGAIIGGTFCGYWSEYLGRRRTIVTSVFLAGCFIPLYILPRNQILLSVGAFFLYFFVQGSFGVVPAHLNELSPSNFRGTFPGLTYQIGTLASSSSAQIEAILGEKFRRDDGLPDYGRTIGVLASICMSLLILMTLIGKEDKGADFMSQDEDVNININIDGNQLEKQNQVQAREPEKQEQIQQ